MSALDAFLRAIPKVEIHCHLLGTIRKDTFLALAARRRATLTAAEIERFYVRGDKPAGVLRILRALDAEVIREPDDLHRLAYEYLEDAAKHGVRYAELFWNPTGTARESGIAYPRAVDAMIAGMRAAEHDHGVRSRLIPSIDREASPAAALEMVGWMLEHRRDEVIGIGIDYREPEGPPELFAEAYRAARRGGLRTTAHAGEFGMPWTYVKTAVEVLQVDRIDHGYTVLEDPAFARRCAEAGLIFTVAPTNSYYLRTLSPERWALDHPIRHMPAAGLRIHPNTDDPTLHGVTPSRAWALMMTAFGFGLDDLRSFMLNGLDGAWLDDATRREWRRDWAAEFDRLRAALPEAPA